MLVEIRPVARLRGKTPLDVTTPLTAVLDTLRDGTVDLSRVRVVCDWIQYKANFRDVVDVRQIGPGTPGQMLEVAVDLRRAAACDVSDLTRQLLAQNGNPDTPARVWLEEWLPGSQGCLWSFNRLYWQALHLWERATGRGYESALPGGASDARNESAIRELISDLFRIWDDLSERRSLPEELYVVELGVGNGNQAKAWLDEFLVMDHKHGRDYYRRLHYLLCDYSPHVLDIARKNVSEHGDHVSSLVLDATTPTTVLGFLRYKVFLVYVSNVYDNLPCDEVVNIGGQAFCVETRAYLPAKDAEQIALTRKVDVSSLPALVHKLLQIGPELLAEAMPTQFADADAAVTFWRDCWQALRRAERFIPMPGLDSYQITSTLSGEMLRPLLDAHGDLRINVNNGAVASFVDTLPLLHPYGRLVCHDLFITDVEQSRTGFRGPGKYDGSVVNWVNGPLLAHIGSRKGIDVRYEPFAHRKGTSIVTMTAQLRD
ncbi:MAG: class I SAM-dependent methyltransferase [Geodermatophilaceae bacterium]